VFITGWNEWVMGRMPEFIHYKAANVMVDQFNEEFSRDIEPSRTVIGDNAYYQFVAWLRKFKGVRPIPLSKIRKTIDITGNFSQWKDVEPEYLDDIGDIEERFCEGYGAAGLYVNKTGQNDLALMKVTRDDRFVYFYAAAAESLTPCKDRLWMNLLLRTDFSGKNSGWEGFQYLVRPDNANRVTLYRAMSTNRFHWQVLAAVDNRAEENEFMIKVPLAFLGLDGSSSVMFDFKWCDNVPLGTDIEYCFDFYTSGDTAPNGRFSYRYLEK
jgi:hypothetical protein